MSLSSTIDFIIAIMIAENLFLLIGKEYSKGNLDSFKDFSNDLI